MCCGGLFFRPLFVLKLDFLKKKHYILNKTKHDKINKQ